MAHDEDRQPIVVKDGSLIFDAGEVPNGKPRPLHWKKDLIGNQWRPDQPKGKSVEHFSVTAFGTVAPCRELIGTTIAIDYALESGTTVRVTVYRRPNWKGHFDPKVDLSEYTGPVVENGRELKLTAPGRMVGFTVSGDRTTCCEFLKDGVGNMRTIVIHPIGRPETGSGKAAELEKAFRKRK